MARSEDEGFLSRWARRKAQQEEAAEERVREPGGDHVEPTQGKQNEITVDAAEAEPAVEEPVAAEDLPDPETLGRDDDWTPYLKRNVPSELRVKALRRLWRLDPVYANLDGLVDYAEDYNGPAFTGEPVKTLFQVGRGMVLPEKQEAAEEGATESTAAPAQELPGTAETVPAADEEQQDAEAATDSEDPRAAPQASGDSVSKAPVSVDLPAGQGEPAEGHQRRPRRALARRWGSQ
ncbi:DUF3306 domain-containing protein [Aquibaculum sediminis]|uniref:DUF3306 domain-containing protein n=1 Tax=Aquibaculum sediminis TaxID=3231907 RepID=UPI003456C14D